MTVSTWSGGQAAAAHGHLMSVEDIADRASFDTESSSQFIHRCSGLITGDQLRDSVGIELPCLLWLGRATGGGAGIVMSGSFWIRISRASNRVSGLLPALLGL
ncbi:hypothetical protein [Nocardia fusca]|uniref:hypothetical protein n=1 Tax=Nocardia fusca TaxID=941183 RepID=UPI0012F4FA36|nr:hypothetical protein [Nocardia fusca]